VAVKYSAGTAERNTVASMDGERVGECRETKGERGVRGGMGGGG